MDSIIDGVTSTLVTKSLDFALMRHQVIANNIANVNTDNFRPLRLSFEEQLQSIKRRFEAGVDEAHLMNQLELVSAHVNLHHDEHSASVVLDREVALLAQNTLKYQALLSARGELSSILSTVIKGGNR